MLDLFVTLESLVTQYLDPNEKQLPSPEALKYKIILKVKLLIEGVVS